jgi:hypothetical protein
VQALTEQLAAAQEAAAGALAEAQEAIAPLAEGQSAPEAAQAAAAEAQGAAAQGEAQAQAGETPGAQASAEAAADALSEAAAAVALAQAGLGSPESPLAGQPSEPGQQPGEQPGQQPGQQPGSPGTEPGQGEPPPVGDGLAVNFDGSGGADGPRVNNTGTSRFIGLPDRERGTINQSAAESFPAEYGSMIEQYLKNLSDKASN